MVLEPFIVSITLLKIGFFVILRKLAESTRAGMLFCKRLMHITKAKGMSINIE
jgi:hypothetical protein